MQSIDADRFLITVLIFRHGIANPTSNDVRHENPSYYYPRGVFRLWPPRLIDVDEPGAVIVK